MKYLIIILLLSGCYTAKKAEKQTDKAYSHYPAMVAAKSASWFPCIPTDSTETVEVILAPEYDYYMKYIDSLLSVKAKVEKVIVTQYKDTCKSAVNSYNTGFNLGYEVGKYEGLRDCIPDTMRITRTIKIMDSAKIYLANNEVVQIKKQMVKLEKKITRRNTWLWIFGIGFLLSAGFIVLAILFKLKVF